MRIRSILHGCVAAATISTLIACGNKQQASAADAAEHDHSDSASTDSTQDDAKFPAAGEHVMNRLRNSPRHGEYVMIPVSNRDSIRAWVVFPERSTPAPVVVVAHEIYGLTSWIRGVADQLAAEGFLAIAPDLVSLQKVQGSPDSAANQDAYVKAVSALSDADIRRYLSATIKYATSLPAATQKVGVVGFCRGGAMAFMYASTTRMDAAVVYYGASPSPEALDSIKTPVLGLYAGDDARVNATVPAAEEAMKTNRRTFEQFTYKGAGHGFLRQQGGGTDGANLEATKQAWPATIAWFRRYLEG